MKLNRLGDSDRFYRLVWPHMATVLRAATFLTRNQADAEDLAQDVMLKAFRSIGTLHDEARVRPWLLTILRHAQIDHLRASRHAELSLELVAAEPQGKEPAEQLDPAAFWEEPEAALGLFTDADVIAALRDLPKDIRWTLLLVDVEGLEDSEAASVLAIPTGTVKSRLHRRLPRQKGDGVPGVQERRHQLLLHGQARARLHRVQRHDAGLRSA